MQTYTYTKQSKPASEFTVRRNREAAAALSFDFSDPQNEEAVLAREGLLKSAGAPVIRGKDGTVVWDLNRFRFLTDRTCPGEIHPGLWFNGQMNLISGLFEVVPGKIYQVRGFDLANLSLVRSRTGWIVFDCMTNVETAEAAVAFASEVLKEDIRNHVRAVIVSHSHLDHYGGLRGVAPEEKLGKEIPIFVPAGYDLEVVREHVYSGNAMARRKKYQVGSHDSHSGETDLVSTGIGLTQPRGHASFVAPTDVITEDCVKTIDGLPVEFMLTPETEAPAEMINFIPEYHALWGAELLNGTLHNLYPVRGAQVRDGLAWASYLTEALRRWGGSMNVVFQSHNWPRRNTPEAPDAVQRYLRNTAAAYRYIHDQTLQLANQGAVPEEIARTVKLPDALQNCGYLRPFYGTVPFNCRAVYQKYLGFYDCNPVHLDPLPPKEAAARYVRYMGGADAVLKNAEEDFRRGDYAWVAEVTNRVVFAEPENEKARLLCADAMEQLAYQSESGIWRNAYLTGAKELRYGYAENAGLKKGNGQILDQVSPDFLLDYMGIVLDAGKTGAMEKELSLAVTDHRKTGYYRLRIVFGALLVEHYGDVPCGGSPLTIRKEELTALVHKRLDDVSETMAEETFRTLKDWEELLVDLDHRPPFAVSEP